MYATLPEYWTTTASNYTNTDVKTNNWMYIGLYEWTISRTSTIGYGARRVGRTGDAYGDSGVYGYCGVRPVLYLTSDVKITGGYGTETDPFQLEV